MRKQKEVAIIPLLKENYKNSRLEITFLTRKLMTHYICIDDMNENTSWFLIYKYWSSVT